MENLLTDKNGFYIDKNGKHIGLIDKSDGRHFFEFSNGLIIKFKAGNMEEARSAAEQLAQVFSDGFINGISGFTTISLSAKAREKGYISNTLQIPIVNRYFDGINNFLNYVGNIYGFRFKEYFYIKYKDKVKNTYLSYKSGLYNNIPKEHIKFAKMWFKQTDKLFEQEHKYNIKQTSPHNKNQFSILEWATIFYYADETNLLSDDKAVKKRWEKFMKDYNIETSSENFKKSYYTAKRRINDKRNYPIEKLQTISPFLKENFSKAVTKLDNDIFFLKEEQPDY